MPLGLLAPLCVVLRNAFIQSEFMVLRRAIDSNDGAGGFNIGLLGWLRTTTWQLAQIIIAKSRPLHTSSALPLSWPQAWQPTT